MVFAVVLLGSAPVAGAQDRRVAPRHVNFDDADVVQGGRVGPDGLVVRGRHRLPRRSLIRLRSTYVPEVLKTVEDV